MTNEVEIADVEKVEAALAAMSEGKLDQAETLLLEVIAHIPENYTNEEEDEEGLEIKFWDQNEFIHYVTWMQDQEIQKGVKWIGNAYPRALYYLGFLCVKRKQFQRAIDYLDQGRTLEPENPNFLFEKAQTLVHLKNPEAALALYDQVVEVGAYVSLLDMATAQRGRGFVLIEMGKLDDAETAFRTSLEIAPDSQVAISELEYIQHLRQGGTTSGAFDSVETLAPSLSDCAICGKEFEEGVMISVEGIPVSICKRCERKLTKKWWQFWK